MRRAEFIQACWAILAQGTNAFGGAKAGDQRSVAGVKLSWCPPGRFRMGSPPEEPGRRSDEGPVEVTISKGFWIGTFEVTQAEWKRFYGPFVQPMDKGEGDDFPIYWVNYLEAEGFCRRLTDKSRSLGELPENWEFRLPTEAQWEYACRAGTATATSFGDRLSSKQASFNGTVPYNGGEAGPVFRQAIKVGSYSPNAWGIFDMHGSEWEWCRDWYHPTLPGGTDPDLSGRQGQMNRDGTYSRVRRGGAWIEEGWTCRSAMRLRYEPPRRSDHIGFRVVAVGKL